MRRMIMLVAVVMVLAMGIGMSVMAATDKEASYVISNEQYKEMEQECLQEVKLILLEKGCKDAGVTLTYVTMEDGSREYTVCVHHAKLDVMESEEYGLLQARIKELVRDNLMAEASIKII